MNRVQIDLELTTTIFTESLYFFKGPLLWTTSHINDDIVTKLILSECLEKNRAAVTMKSGQLIIVSLIAALVFELMHLVTN